MINATAKSGHFVLVIQTPIPAKITAIFAIASFLLQIQTREPLLLSPFDIYTKKSTKKTLAAIKAIAPTIPITSALELKQKKKALYSAAQYPNSKYPFINEALALISIVLLRT